MLYKLNIIIVEYCNKCVLHQSIETKRMFFNIDLN